MLQASLLKILLDIRISTVAYLLLLLMLAYQLSVLFWQVYPEPTVTNNVVSNLLVQSAEQTSQQPGYLEKAELIGRTFLFGKPAVKKAVVETVEQAPETKLNYKLRGVYFSDQYELAAAIVELKPNHSQYFRVDDELDESITISAIGRDHILINRYGKIERLNLEKPKVSGASRVASTRTDSNSLASSKLLKSYKRRYVSNPLALAKRFQAIPVQENGSNIGFRLKALRGESLLKKLNFGENDIFTKINGISLDKPFQALDALKSLATANAVSVTILRNGNEETMEFTL
ncbi:MAG: hypothetical protein GY820_37425 [Gammaproteobacteria bacterium]|nr:hypothetical protein [Gammaproteobacteria bacterium]